MKLKFIFNNGVITGPANIALKVDYCFVSSNNTVILGTTASTITPDITRSTGWIAYPVSTSANKLFFTEILLNLAGLNNNEDSNTQDIWINIRRDVSSSGGLDTYADSIYLQTLHIETGQWCIGGYIN